MIVILQSGRVERINSGEVPDCQGHYELMQWTKATPDLHEFLPDYHRCQLERWVWDKLQPTPTAQRVLDIGVYDRREWIGPEYRTFGPKDTAADVVGDLVNDDFGGPWDVVLCTEVLEHCESPKLAVQNIYDALVPGGRMLATSPFLWPDHHTQDYPDYWRFTEQAWRLLCRPFATVTVTPSQWTAGGAAAYHLLRDAEGMGFSGMTLATTGFLVEAVK